MTDISAFIAALKQQHIQLQLIHGQLKTVPPEEMLSESLWLQISVRKAEIIAFLSNPNTHSAPAGKPLSYAQLRLWLLQQTHPEQIYTSVNHSFTLEGNLNLGALKTALELLIQRHEILRTTINIVNNEPRQIVQSEFTLPLQQFDLSGHEEAEQQALLNTSIHSLLTQQFNLATQIPLNIGLYRLSASKHILIIAIHPIATDNWASTLLRRDLSQLYSATVARQAIKLPKLTLQYGDFAEWQHQWLQGQVLQQHLDFWSNELEGLKPQLHLPTDFPRPQQATYLAGEQNFTLDATFSARLRNFSKQHNVTVFMSLFVALQILLYRLSEQRNFALATPILNRQRQDLENVIGLFVNTLILKSNVNPQDSFSSLLEKTRKQTINTLKFPHLPFARLVEELAPTLRLEPNPLAQVLVAMQNMPTRRNQWGNLQVEPYPLAEKSIGFEMELYIREEQDQLQLSWLYRKDLWTAATVTHWADCFQTLLTHCINTPTIPVRQLAFVPAETQAKILQQWSSGLSQPIQNQCVHHLLELQALKSPDAVAVRCGNQHLSYAELNTRSNQLAHFILAQDVSIETPVLIALDASIAMIVSIFGILKAGCTYIPLDPAIPATRLQHLLADAQPLITITQAHLLTAQQDPSVPRLNLDHEWPQIEQYPGHNPNRIISLKNLAYIHYVSLAPGQPKGVMIEHYALSNLLAAVQKQIINPQPGDVCLHLSPLSIDCAALEIYLPLISGATMLLVEPALMQDPQLLPALLTSYPPQLMQATPSYYELLLLAGWRPTAGLTMLCGGETLTTALAEQLLQPETTLWNLYGATETTLWVTACRITAPHHPISIGRPLFNTEVYVLDTELQGMPLSTWGELYIGGLGVARGYLNNTELTQSHFVAHPFSKNSAARLFKTGDKVRWLANGSMEFAARFDKQIKISGHRVDLAEIEATLLLQEAISKALVVYVDDALEAKLVAYCISPLTELDCTQIRQTLQQLLPAYMLPRHLISLPAFPLTPNGEIDLALLARSVPTSSLPSCETLNALTDMAAKLQQLYQELLQPGYSIGEHDNFFTLGGTTRTALQLLTRLSEALEQSVPLALFLQNPTIAELSFALEQRSIKNSHAPVPATSAQPVPQPAIALPPEFYAALVQDALSNPEPRLHADSLLYRLNAASTAPALYLCGADREIARHCSAYQVFGLPSGLGVLPLNADNISLLARYYAQEILAHNPSGPYYLGGYGAGARMAFELAQQLQQQGKSVDLLLLIDQIIFQPYAGPIAFYLFQQNPLLRDVQQPGSHKILRKFFPHGWSIDIIPGHANAVISYPAAMIVYERMQARIQAGHLKALARAAYKVEWTLLDMTRTQDQITLSLSLKNTSAFIWPAQQLAIGHHWQDLHGVLVSWAVKTEPLRDSLLPGETQTVNYSFAKIPENGNLFVILDLLDQGNSWFSLQGAASFRTLITYNAASVQPETPALAELDHLYAQAQWQQLIPLCQQALSTYPATESSRINLKLAEAFLACGRNESAKAIILKALQTDNSRTHHALFNLMLATIHLQAGAFSDALNAATIVLAQQSNNEQALAIVGLAQAHQGNLIAAEQTFNKATQLYAQQKLPTELSKQLEAFCFILDKHHNDSALKYAQWLVQKEPYNPLYAFNNAYFLFQRQYFQQAEKLLLQALELYPEQVNYYTNLAKVYTAQENPAAAAATYRKLTKLLPLRLEHFIHLAKLRAELQEYQAALDTLEHAARINPDDEQLQQSRQEIKQLRLDNLKAQRN